MLQKVDALALQLWCLVLLLNGFSGFTDSGALDLADYSDEEAAFGSPCPALQFRCTDGQCIGASYKCDSYPDCEDGSDESSSICNPDPICSDVELFDCSANDCIPSQWVCDGDTDCPDGSDEIGCNVTCDPIEEFDCGRGYCISMSLICNSIPDCFGWDDESPDLCGKDECLIDNGGCSQICLDLPNGFQCECKEGYNLIDDRTCAIMTRQGLSFCDRLESFEREKIPVLKRFCQVKREAERLEMSSPTKINMDEIVSWSRNGMEQVLVGVQIYRNLVRESTKVL